MFGRLVNHHEFFFILPGSCNYRRYFSFGNVIHNLPHTDHHAAGAAAARAVSGVLSAGAALYLEKTIEKKDSAREVTSKS